MIPGALEKLHSVTKSLAGAAVALVLAAPLAARAVSDGNYDPERQGCTAEGFTYEKRNSAEPGCHNTTVTVGPAEDPNAVRAGLDQTPEAAEAHSGSVEAGSAGATFDTGAHLGGFCTLSDCRMTPPALVPGEPSAALREPSGLPAVPSDPTRWSFYFGMDDNIVFGEHHSISQAKDPERDGSMAVGPVSGGSIRADTHPTDDPADNVDATDGSRPVRAADAGFGFCSDGQCMTGQTEERTVYQGGAEGERAAQDYGEDFHPADCQFRDPEGNCREYYDRQPRVYASPGVTVYQDPDPQAPEGFGPVSPGYPMPSAHVGPDGVAVNLRPEARHLAVSPASTPGTIRVFAIGYRHRLDHLGSYDDYANHLKGLAAAADPAGPGDSDPRPKLFVFPEDSALFAMFSGERARPLREMEPLFRQGGGNGSAAAVAALFGLYQREAAFYRAKFPEQNLSQARLGLLALTDTLYRTFFETFRAIAVEHRAWVVASVNIAPARIVTDQGGVAALASPEDLARPCGTVPAPCAYEATSPNVYNQAFVFDPDGNLHFNPFAEAREGDLDGAVKKTYLDESEQGPLEQGKIGLDLAYGDLRQVRPIEIAGVPMGILISKPAWMLDELGRLEAYDTAVTLQPEAFSSWAVPEEPSQTWSPDVLKQSGWSQAQKYAPFRWNVLSELTGNFFDLVFDAQNHVVAKATTKGALAAGYIGQPDDAGWTAVSPWGVAAGVTCAQQDRACFADAGRKLAPGSGDDLENAYDEPLAVADLVLDDPAADPTRVPAVLGTNARVDDAPAGARARNPKIALAANRRATFVVWQDDRSGTDQIRIARVNPGGQVSDSRAVAPSASRQIFPQVAVAPDGRIHVVWQELDPAPRIWRSSAASWDDAFGPAVPVGLEMTPLDVVGLVADEGWKPAIAVGLDGTLHVAWIGLEGDDVEGRFDRLFYTRVWSAADGTYEEETARLDDEAFLPPHPHPLAERLNNRWNPAIAVRENTVAIAWTDFRNYAWDLFATVSRDGGDSFLPQHLRVDDAPNGLERLHNDPSVAIDEAGGVLVAWTDQAGRRAGCATCAQQRRPDTDVGFASLAAGATAFAANTRIDATGDGLTTGTREGFSNQWRPALAIGNGKLFAVWQDHREGNNDVFLATSSGGASWTEVGRVDDTGGGPSNQYSPAAVCPAGGAITIVWQDDREGEDHVYMARGSAP